MTLGRCHPLEAIAPLIRNGASQAAPAEPAHRQVVIRASTPVGVISALLAFCTTVYQNPFRALLDVTIKRLRSDRYHSMRHRRIAGTRLFY